MKFSVIIPVFEQWSYIPQLIECLSKQTLSVENFEIILVDNGTSGFVAPQIDYPGAMRILTCNRAGSYAARNMGIEGSVGDWLVFTDADCLPAREWLTSIRDLIEIEGSRNLVIAGSVEVAQTSDLPGPYEIYDFVKGIPQDEYVQCGYAATANLTTSRALVQSVGGFKESVFSGGDKEFCRRAVKCGARISYASCAKVQHRARVSWSEIAAKARRLKGGQYFSVVKEKRIVVAIRTFLPPLFAVIRFFRSDHYPLRYRLTAAFVHMRIWGVEMIEIVRLMFLGGNPERR